MKYTLNPGEQRVATYLALARTKANREQSVKDGKVGPQSGDETDKTGVGGELAFAKLFHVFPDLSIKPRRGTPDCTRRGVTIDVKATKYRTGRLLAVPSKLQHSGTDLYALMIEKWPAFEFVGWATAGELLTPEHLTDLGHGPTYAMEQHELTKPG